MNALAVQPAGKVLAAGDFDFVNGPLTGKLQRLNPDDSLDASFNPVATPQSIFNGEDIVTGAVIQPTDNKVVLYGPFRYVAGQAHIGLRLSSRLLANRGALVAQPLEVFPNPAHSTVTLQLPAAPQPRMATLLDLQGRRVRQWMLPARQLEAQLNLDAISAGVYLLQVQDSHDLHQQKVVITR